MLMKFSIWISALAFLALATLPQSTFAAIAKQKSAGVQFEKTEKSDVAKVRKHSSFKEKIGRKFANFKQQVRHWKEAIQMRFPSGKLLTSLVLLLGSIVFFALAGATTLGVLFNLLGSAAVIAAVIFFVLWLSERTSIPSPGN